MSTTCDLCERAATCLLCDACNVKCLRGAHTAGFKAGLQAAAAESLRVGAGLIRVWQNEPVEDLAKEILLLRNPADPPEPSPFKMTYEAVAARLKARAK